MAQRKPPRPGTQPPLRGLTPAEAITDGPLAYAFQGQSWDVWRACLKAAWGRPLNDAELVLFHSVAGDRPPPAARVSELWVAAGRRSGKDSVASAICACLATGDYSGRLRPGERATILMLANGRDQARVLRGYVVGLFQATPLLAALVNRETDDGLELNNGVEILIGVNNFRWVRGRTILAVVLDECGFYLEGDYASPADELYAALRPAMATLQPDSLLVGISSPWKRSGLLYDKWRAHFAQPGDDVLFLHGGTRAFNSSMPQTLIDRDIEIDAEKASSEWLAEWRDDVAGLFDEPLLWSATDVGVTIRPAQLGVDYVMGGDLSDGKADSTAAAIGHIENGRIIVDALYERRAPFVPSEVFRELADFARPYRITRVVIDKFAAGMVGDGLKGVGLLGEVRERSTSDTYLLAVPSFTEGSVRLPDDRRLRNQFVQLQRRLGASGKATVTHPVGSHDDLAAATCNLIVALATDARPSVIDHRRMADDVEEPAGIYGVIGTVWVGDAGRYGWLVCGCCNLLRPGEEKQVVLATGEGAWSWSVLCEVAAAMKAAAELAPLYDYAVRGIEIAAVLLVQDVIQSPAALEMARVFSVRATNEMQMRNIGAYAIEGSWLADTSRLLLGVSALVNVGRVKRAPSIDPSIFRYLAVKVGERVEDEPLRVAMLINFAQLMDGADMPITGPAARLAW